MAWRLTHSIDAFLDAAGDHLHAEPVLHTVPLTVLERLRLRARRRSAIARPCSAGMSPPRRHRWRLLQTPPHPVLVATLPPGSAGSLVDLLGAEQALPGAVNVAAQDETAS